MNSLRAHTCFLQSLTPGAREPQVKEDTQSLLKCPAFSYLHITSSSTARVRPPTSGAALMSFLQSSAHPKAQRFTYPLVLLSACGLSPPPWTSKLHTRAIAYR